MTTPSRPLPQPDDASRPYWEAAKRRELVVQRCGACRRLRFPPQPMCDACRSLAVEWAPMSGRGTIFSFVVAHPPVLPAFQERAPFAIVLVELDEDPRLRIVGNLLQVPPAAARIGLPVEVAFEDVSDAITLPQWRPRATALQ